MKYVTFAPRYPKDNEAFLYMTLIFGEHVSHAQCNIRGYAPVSAGFFYLKNGIITVHGASLSLRLKPHPIDHELIKRTLNGQKTSAFLSSTLP